jgi:hypothetical protein
MTIEGQNGDAAQAIEAGVEEYGKRVTREAVTVWNTEAQKRIMEAAGGRTDIDAARDMRGSLTGREENELHQLAKEFTAPVWDDANDQWIFACTHAFASLHEWGAMPHEIEARRAQALVFEWPDMPSEVREDFEAQWESTDNFLTEPMVAFSNVDHPGLPAIGFMRYGRQKAREELRDMGVATEGFAERSAEVEDG